jgi:hypothetical protein
MTRQDRNIGARQAHLLARAVREHRLQLAPSPDQVPPQPECDEIAILPTLAQKLASGSRRVMQRAFSHEQWFIAAEHVGSSQVGNTNTSLLVPPRDRFYADPFPFEHNGRTYMFFEELLFADGKGRISFVEVKLDGTFSEPRVALETGFHLSYPSIFQWRGEIYMLPEMSAAGQQRLFRAKEFPHCWEPNHILLDDVRLADPTLHEQDGIWWLFGSGVHSDGDMNSELHLFYADSPLGPWKSHPRNPIVSDVRRARPAGRVYRQGQIWIRPGQDCASRYGAGIALCRIDVLTTTEYRETPVARIGPEWMAGNVGTHTINTSSTWRVWDGRVRIPKYLRIGAAPRNLKPQCSAFPIGDYA